MEGVREGICDFSICFLFAEGKGPVAGALVVSVLSFLLLILILSFGPLGRPVSGSINWCSR